jgi:YbgC/YbaW family acyl-CoA thioester hydrolase
MPHDYRMTHRVEFAETDMAGIVHFANFFRYMEITEHAFLRSLGLAVHWREGGRVFGLPRVHAECDFRQPLRYQDEVEVHLLVREKREKSLTYEFVFRKLSGNAGAEGAMEVARGKLAVVSVAVDRETGQMASVPLPAAFVDAIQVAPGEES